MRNKAAQALVITGILLTACGNENSNATETVPVTVLVVQPMMMAETVYAPCRLEAGYEAVVSVPVPGVVECVLVSPGDTVAAGQSLIELRTDDLQRGMISDAAAVLSVARASAEYAGSNLRRAQELLESGAVSVEEYQRIETEARASEATLTQASSVYGASLNAAESGLVLAPFDGVVGRVIVTEGNPAAGPLLSIFSSDVLRAELLVSPRHIHKLKTGLPAVFTTDHFPGEVFPGRVVSVSETVDAVSGLVALSVQFSDTTGALVPGLSGMAVVSLDTKENALVLPGNVMTPLEENIWEVAVVRNNTVSIQRVTSGIRNGNRYEITEGLQPGDSVIVLGNTLVSSGTMIRVVR